MVSKAQKKIYNRKYSCSTKGKLTRKRYNQSVEGKLMRKKAFQRDRKILRNLKINGCAICGYNECTACLDFHHTNPQDKKFQVAINSVHRRNKSIVEEVNKCILLCKNCHTKIHYKELD